LLAKLRGVHEGKYSQCLTECDAVWNG